MESGIDLDRNSLYWSGDPGIFVTANNDLYIQIILHLFNHTLVSWHYYELQWQNAKKTETFQDGVSKAIYTTDVPTGDLVGVFREGSQIEDKFLIDLVSFFHRKMEGKMWI